VAGNARSLERRKQILVPMARNGYISEELARRCQDEPVGVVRAAVAKTEAPAVIEHVLDELQRHGGARFTVEDRISACLSSPARPEAARPIAAIGPRHVGGAQWIVTDQSISPLSPRRLHWRGSVERLP